MVQSANSYVNEDLTTALALISTIDYYVEEISLAFVVQSIAVSCLFLTLANKV